MGDSTETVQFHSMDEEKCNFIITEFFGTIFKVPCVLYTEIAISKLRTAHQSCSTIFYDSTVQTSVTPVTDNLSVTTQQHN